MKFQCFYFKLENANGLLLLVFKTWNMTFVNRADVKDREKAAPQRRLPLHAELPDMPEGTTDLDCAVLSSHKDYDTTPICLGGLL